ncbi:MAG TPA: hypothetical protein VFG76_08445, partial [Candidatus Polarisedimenticolia bacterium]|nr:hypothetical protein [Candidatus Polarisedimenticolia bacterium]
MESPFSARLVQMLGDVSRNLRTGHLLLGDEAAGSLRFTNGELAGFEPPRDLGQPLPAPGDVAALRRCLEQAARHALARGGAPTFRPSRADEPAAPPLPAGLAAADLALDFCRLIQDVAWLEQHLKGSADDRLRPPAQPPVLQPRLALGASEGFLLSRADGSLTL